MPRAADTLAAVAKAYDAGRCEVAQARQLPTLPDFPQLPSRARSMAYALLALCDGASTHEATLKAIAEPEAPSLAYLLRASDAMDRNEFAEAVEAFHAAVDRKSDSLFLIGDFFVLESGGRLQRADPALFRRFMADLDRADWEPRSPYAAGDWLWAPYAGQLAADGDKAHAWRVASKVRDVGQLVRMSLDKRYDAVTAIDPSHFDPEAAAQFLLERDRANLTRDPQDGDALLSLSHTLRFLSRQDEALALVDAALAKSTPIHDWRGNDCRNWILNERAILLAELGQVDKGIAAMREAAGHLEDGRNNVSQAINLSSGLLSAGRFSEVIDTLAGVDKLMPGSVSAYGQMWVATNRACALMASGRAGEAAKDLAFTATHAADNWSARSLALLCANDIDGAAAAYRARLKSPNETANALVDLSRFKPAPVVTPFDQEIEARLEKVRHRSDVQAAVAEVGRTRDFPIQNGALGN